MKSKPKSRDVTLKKSQTSIMKEYAFLPNRGLRGYFDGVRRGQPEEYRTNFYGQDTPVEDVLSGWDNTLQSIGDQWPTLLDFELDLRKKVGPMSVRKPLKQRMEDIDHYYDDILLPSEPISTEALSATIEEFGSKVGGLRIRSTDSTLFRMKLSTNSGLPYFTKRRRVVDLTARDSGHLMVNPILSYVCGGRRYKGAAILGWRGQEGGPNKADVKQRVVWMFPFSVNLEELRVYQPLIEACQIHGLVPAWSSMRAVDKAITELFHTKNPNDLVICTDFSKFDQHFNREMQFAAHQILSLLLTDGAEEDKWLDDVFWIKYAIPLMYDWGRIREGYHGMASGSGGTNADETLAHRALQYEVALAHNQDLNPYSQCLGDDGILSYPGITVDDVVKSYSSHGQEMNPDKQYASTTDTVYLRRWHHQDYTDKNGVCVGVYSTYRALGRLCEQERFYDPEIWSEKMVALRQLSIIENCNYHPLREQFADYCIKGDKFRLGLDIPGFLDDIERIALEASDLMPDFLGYTKSQQGSLKNTYNQVGIKDWWIVRYLKSKR